MSDDPFNKDMDSYLRKRKKNSDYSYVEAETKEEVVEPEEVYEEEMPENHEETGDGFFQKLKNWFNGDDDPQPEPEPEDIHFECREDIKELGKVALAVSKNLSDEDLLSFKESTHYQALREILRKYDLIKKE